MEQSSAPSGGRDRPLRRVAIVLAVLAAAAAAAFGLASRFGVPAGPSVGRVFERVEAGTEIRLSVEMPQQALKTDIEATARQLLADLPADRGRRLDFWLGPPGPYNPVYATVSLKPSEASADFRVYLHRH